MSVIKLLKKILLQSSKMYNTQMQKKKKKTQRI